MEKLEGLEKFNKEDLNEILNMFGMILEKMLPENYGFTLLTYPHNEARRLYYVSNSQREDVIKAMKEFIEKTETTWGKHDGLED